MEFQVLGPFEVRRDDVVLPLGGAGQRSLLAILVLRANQVVGTDRLIDLLWGDVPPDSALHMLHVQVSRLRKVLEADPSNPTVLVTSPPGYVLQIPAETVDATRFETLVGAGRGLLNRDPARASETLAQALALWRGEALADLALEPFALHEIARLDELRLSATEDRMDAELSLAHHAEVVGDLRKLASEHPLRERITQQLMLALYRSGRQTEALTAYQSARARLASELGIDPGSALQALERAVLQHDPSLELAERHMKGRKPGDGGSPHSPATPGVLNERLEPEGSSHRHRRSTRLIGVLGALAVIAVVAIPHISRSSGEHGQHVGTAPQPLLLHLDDKGQRIGEMTGVTSVHGFRPRIAVGERAVWVSGLAGLYRIDPASQEAEVTSTLRRGALAIGFHSVWVADGDVLTQIDPATAGPLRTIGQHIEPAVAIGAGGVWTADDGGLVRFDPRAGRWSGRVAVDGTPADIAVSGGEVWYVDFFAGSLTAVDGRTLKVRGTVSIPGSPDIVAVGHDFVWVVDRLSGIVTVVDPETMRLVTQISVAKPATGLAVGKDAIWVTAGNELYSINPSTFETSTVDLGVAALALAVDPSDDSLWVFVDATPVRT